MFYYAHAFVASKLYGSNSKWFLMGSILPDIAITKIIGWDNGLHGRGNSEKFRKFVEKASPSLVELCKGIITHSILDDFTHKHYNGNVGYAYQNNKELSKIVAKYYELDSEVAEQIAHNYIESAVDFLLLQKYPKVEIKVKNVIKTVDINLIADLLGAYFVIDKTKFRISLLEYFKLMSKYDLKLLGDWVLFWEDLEFSLSLKKIDRSKKRELLSLSINLVTDTYEDFINFSIRRGLKEIKSFE